eukprot:SAG31_NODE_4616_length_3094_cov_1.782638_1_plen_74_part_10
MLPPVGASAEQRVARPEAALPVVCNFFCISEDYRIYFAILFASAASWGRGAMGGSAAERRLRGGAGRGTDVGTP